MWVGKFAIIAVHKLCGMQLRSDIDKQGLTPSVGSYLYWRTHAETNTCYNGPSLAILFKRVRENEINKSHVLHIGSNLIIETISAQRAQIFPDEPITCQWVFCWPIIYVERTVLCTK